MRFLKIFAISFLSLITGISATVGVMFAVGALNEEKIHPTEIHFEMSNYYVDSNFSLSVQTETPDVTETKVTLKLKNQTSGVKNGEITDGVIIIPQTVQLGQVFTVKLVSALNQEINKDWIIGGVSEITATSESDHAIDAKTNVYVDVPVYELDIKTYSNDTLQTEKSEFAIGESFYAEAIFKPASSKYKFSTTETKKVFFDTSSSHSTSIVKNEEMTNAMAEQGKGFICGYDVKNYDENVSLKAYTFISSTNENKYSTYEEDDLIRYIKNNEFGVWSSKSLTFTPRSIKDFTISTQAYTNILPFNQLTYIYANNNDLSISNLGIKIESSDGSFLANKIADVGIRAMVKEENSSTLRVATSDEILFLDSKTETIYNELTESHEVFYLPNFLVTNADNSFWKVVPQKEGIEFFFEVCLFKNGDTFLNDENEYIEKTTSGSSYRWIVGDVSSNSVSWIDESTVELTFIDSKESSNKVYPEYNFSKNIKFSNQNGTYKTIKYLAYSEDDTIAVSDIIQNATLTEKYDISAWLTKDVDLYEINGDILKAKKNGTIYILAVVVKNDYLGRLTINEGKYEIDSVSISNGSLAKNIKPLEIQVTKTIQDMNVSVVIEDNSIVMNKTDIEEENYEKLSFVGGSTDSIFDIKVTITADETTSLEYEKALFVDAWNSKKISFNITENNLSSSLIFVDKDTVLSLTSGEGDDSSWSYSFKAYSTETVKDSIIHITLSYQKNNNIKSTQIINQLEIEGVNIIIEDALNIEIYDGLTAKVYFDGIETSEENPVYHTEEISYGSSTDDFGNTIATKVESIYKMWIENPDTSELELISVKNILLNDDGSFKLVFEDKYGNKILEPKTKLIDYAITEFSNKYQFKMLKYSNTISTENIPQTELFIQNSNAGNIVSVSYKETSFSTSKTTLNPFNENEIIRIQRYVMLTEEIQLLGENGLLDVVYQTADLENYQLFDVLDYKMVWSDNYENYFTRNYNEENGFLENLSVDINLGSKIDLTFNVNTKLGTTITLVLTLLPNIEITPSINDENITDNGKSYNVFSDYTFTISLNIKNYLVNDSCTFKYETNCSSDTLISLVGEPWNKETGSFIYLSTTENVFEFQVTFSAKDISALKTITVYTGNGNGLELSRTLSFIINPNLKLKDSVDKTPQIIVDEINVSNSLYSGLNLFDRVVGSKIISKDDLDLITLSISKGTNTETGKTFSKIYCLDEIGNYKLTNNNLFVLSGWGVKLTSKIDNIYKIVFDVKYNNVTVDTIECTIKGNIAPKESESDWFVDYYGTKCLLISKQVLSTMDDKIIFDDIIDKFDNADSLEITNPSGRYQKIYYVEGSELKINALFGQYFIADCLTLESDAQILSFPVLFSLFGKDYLTYSHKDVVDAKISDFGYLMDTDYIIENGFYTSVYGGETTSLLQSVSTYGLTDYCITLSNLKYCVYDEENGRVNKEISQYATFDSSTGNLITQISSVNHFVWLFIYKDENVVAKYRIQIVHNSSLNVFYPYMKTNSNNTDDNNNVDGEYIDATKQDVVINFNNSNATLDKIYPNSQQSITYTEGDTDITNKFNPQRVVLLDNKGIVENTQIAFEISKICVFTNGDNYYEITTKKDILNYIGSNGIMVNDQSGYIKVKKTQNKYIFFVKCWAVVNGYDVGSVVYYKVLVNIADNNGKLYELGTSGELSNNAYSLADRSISFGTNFEFSDIGYDSDDTDQQKIKSTDFDFYVYLEDDEKQKNIEKYIDFDLVNQTVSLQKLEGTAEYINISADLIAHFVAYSKTGQIADIKLIFKSNITHELIDASIDVADGIYTFYSDINYNFYDMFDILKSSTSIKALTSSVWSYSLDGGKNWIDGSSFKVQQSDLKTNQENLYNILIKIDLPSISSDLYPDVYYIEMPVNVLPSVSSNYALTDSPLMIGTDGNIYFDALDNLVNVEDIIFGVNSTTSTLFNVKNISVLNDFECDYQINVGSNCFKSTAVDMITSSWRSENKIYLDLRSPAVKTQVKVTIKLTQGENLILNSHFAFFLVPDLEVKADYPQANASTNFDEEAYYLNTSYINESVSSGVFGSGSFATINFASSNAYFDASRVKFFEYGTNNIANGGLYGLDSRVSISVVSITGNVVLYSNAYLNTNIKNIPFNSAIKVQWISTTTLTSDISATVVFGINVDGLERMKYEIVFYSQISNIFGFNVQPLNDTVLSGNTESEIFFVDNNNSGYIFAKNQAMLSFTLKNSYSSTLQTSSQIVIKQNSTIVGATYIDSTSSNVQILLSDDTNIIEKDNLTICVNGNEYNLGEITEAENFYSHYALKDSLSLTYRSSATYLNETLSYDKLISTFKVVDTSIAYAPEENIQYYEFSLKSESNIDNITTLNIVVDSEIIKKYNYKLVYDFKISESKSFENYVQEVEAGTEYKNLLSSFGITSYSGASFAKNYFVGSSKNISATVIAVENIEYDSAENRFSFVTNEYKNKVDDSESVKGTYNENIMILSLKNDISDFDLSIGGATNDGNYVYILITYSVHDVSIPAYAIVKFKVMPIWESLFTNSNSENNDSDHPYQINYTSGSFAPITLVSGSVDYIDIYKNSDTTTNCALTNFNYSVVGDIADYVTVTKNLSVVISQIPGKVANYGVKTGYIALTDIYGFTLKYYLLLNPTSTDVVKLTGTIVNSLNNSAIYDGSVLAWSNKGDTPEGLYDYVFYVDNIKPLESLITDVKWYINGQQLEATGTNNYFAVLPILDSSFFGKDSDLTSTYANITLSITINDNEVINLTTEIKIMKRYTVSAPTNAYVRDDTDFEVLDYLKINDASLGGEIGEIKLVSTKTLKISDEYIGDKIIVRIYEGENVLAYQEITVGKNAKDDTLTATGNYYYYPLSQFTSLQDYINNPSYSVKCFVKATNIEITDDTKAKFINDKMLSVVTIKNGTETIDILLNNGVDTESITFELNYYGTQYVSVAEKLGDCEYVLNTSCISNVDEQKLKGITIYNNTLALNVASGMFGKRITVTIEKDTILGSASFEIKNDFAHIMYINLHSVLNDKNIYKLDNVTIKYKYSISNLESADPAYEGKVIYVGTCASSGCSATYDALKGGLATYEYTIYNYSTTQLADGLDSVNVLSASAFNVVNKTQSGVEKYYIVEFVNGGICYDVKVSYKVTPIFYAVDNSGNDENRDYKVLTTSQITDNHNGTYTINADDWMENFNLIDKNGIELGQLADNTDNLEFSITTEGAGGAANLDESTLSITTTTDFNPVDQFIKVAVKAKVEEGEYVLIGYVKLSINLSA